MHFVYPRDLVEPRLPDELFRQEAVAVAAGGHVVSLIETSDLAAGPARITPPVTAEAQTVYRGWMLAPTEYENFVRSVNAQGGTVFTSAEQYLATHYLPNWYDRLAPFTPETRVLAPDADFVQELSDLDWPRFFVKDFVKSLKTSTGSVVERPDQIPLLIAEMKHFRGEIEGGICVRRFEEFQPNTERRFFVRNQTPQGADALAPLPEVVRLCANRLDSPFFSVDVAVRSDGVERIVEVGDGQVSDLVGWSIERFVKIWRDTKGTLTL